MFSQFLYYLGLLVFCNDNHISFFERKIELQLLWEQFVPEDKSHEMLYFMKKNNRFFFLFSVLKSGARATQSS